MSFPFRQKKTKKQYTYDPERQQPAVRRSICTGEMTGGLVDRDTGRFHELQLLRTQEELRDFCAQMGVREEELRTIY